MPKIILSSPVNIFGLLTTTTFITLTSHSLKRNIPSAISAAAMKSRINFAEKTTRQISAEKNATAARIKITFPEHFRLRLFGRRICFTSLAADAAFIATLHNNYAVLPIIITRLVLCGQDKRICAIYTFYEKIFQTICETCLNNRGLVCFNFTYL